MRIQNFVKLTLIFTLCFMMSSLHASAYSPKIGGESGGGGNTLGLISAQILLQLSGLLTQISPSVVDPAILTTAQILIHSGHLLILIEADPKRKRAENPDIKKTLSGDLLLVITRTEQKRLVGKSLRTQTLFIFSKLAIVLGWNHQRFYSDLFSALDRELDPTTPGVRTMKLECEASYGSEQLYKLGEVDILSNQSASPRSICSLNFQKEIKIILRQLLIREQDLSFKLEPIQYET